MTTIDIPVGPALQQALDLPPCDMLRIPTPKPLQLALPTGGSMQALTDVSKGIPTDSAMTFSLLQQISPLLAAIDCPLKMLKVLGPLVEAVTGLAKVPPSFPTPELIEKILAAVADLAPCLGLVVPGGSMVPFVKDLLCLIRTVLAGLAGQLRSVRDALADAEASFAAAEGNADLLALLECAQQNTQASMANITQAIEPISAILGLMSPLFEIAQMPAITIEMPGGTPTDADSLTPVVDALQAVVDVIDDATGGICG